MLCSCGSLINNRNKFVLYWPLNEIEFSFFRGRGVEVVRESECYDELSDNLTLRFLGMTPQMGRLVGNNLDNFYKQLI